jgi:hypothetical protein
VLVALNPSTQFKGGEGYRLYAGWLQKYGLVEARINYPRGSNIGGQQPSLLNSNHPAPTGQREGCQMSKPTWPLIRPFPTLGERQQPEKLCAVDEKSVQRGGKTSAGTPDVGNATTVIKGNMS